MFDPLVPVFGNANIGQATILEESMTAPLTDEPKVQQILTELVRYARERGDTRDSNLYPLIKTAIANAAEQIRQQERERVEKARDALIVFGHHKKLCPCLHKSNVWKNKRLICNCGYMAALKELEADGE